MTSRTRARVARLHRWLAVALAPVIVLILLSGIVLAFRPVVQRAQPDDTQAIDHVVDGTRLIALVRAHDTAGSLDVVAVPGSGKTAILVGPHGEGAFDVATGAAAPMPRPPAARERRTDPFEIAERVHKDLWFGLGGLVTLGSIAMLFLVIAGPILARPSRGGGPLGRHIRGGWWLWPLVAMLPFSLVAMKLHRPITGSPGPRRALAEMLVDVSRSADLANLEVVQRLPNNSAFVVVDDSAGPQRYELIGTTLRPMENGLSRIGRAVHEGTWAGPWSAALNVIAALATLWVLGTGLLSWKHRLGRDRARRSRSDGVRRAATEQAA